MLSTDFTTNCAPTFIENTDILITLENTSNRKQRTWMYNRLQ